MSRMSRQTKPGNTERGWNDPPFLIYGSGEQSSAPPRKNILSKRVAFPLSTPTPFNHPGPLTQPSPYTCNAFNTYPQSVPFPNAVDADRSFYQPPQLQPPQLQPLQQPPQLQPLQQPPNPQLPPQHWQQNYSAPQPPLLQSIHNTLLPTFPPPSQPHIHLLPPSNNSQPPQFHGPVIVPTMQAPSTIFLPQQPSIQPPLTSTNPPPTDPLPTITTTTCTPTEVPIAKDPMSDLAVPGLIDHDDLQTPCFHDDVQMFHYTTTRLQRSIHDCQHTSERRLLAEVARKVRLFEEQWKQQNISYPVKSCMARLATAIHRRRFDVAEELQMSLVLDHITESSRWSVAVKRLIQEVRKVQSHPLSPSVSCEDSVAAAGAVGAAGGGSAVGAFGGADDISRISSGGVDNGLEVSCNKLLEGNITLISPTTIPTNTTIIPSITHIIPPTTTIIPPTTTTIPTNTTIIPSTTTIIPPTTTIIPPNTTIIPPVTHIIPPTPPINPLSLSSCSVDQNKQTSTQSNNNNIVNSYDSFTGVGNNSNNITTLTNSTLLPSIAPTNSTILPPNNITPSSYNNNLNYEFNNILYENNNPSITLNNTTSNNNTAFNKSHSTGDFFKAHHQQHLQGHNLNNNTSNNNNNNNNAFNNQDAASFFENFPDTLSPDLSRTSSFPFLTLSNNTQDGGGVCGDGGGVRGFVGGLGIGGELGGGVKDEGDNLDEKVEVVEREVLEEDPSNHNTVATTLNNTFDPVPTTTTTTHDKNNDTPTTTTADVEGHQMTTCDVILQSFGDLNSDHNVNNNINDNNKSNNININNNNNDIITTTNNNTIEASIRSDKGANREACLESGVEKAVLHGDKEEEEEEGGGGGWELNTLVGGSGIDDDSEHSQNKGFRNVEL